MYVRICICVGTREVLTTISISVSHLHPTSPAHIRDNQLSRAELPAQGNQASLYLLLAEKIRVDVITGSSLSKKLNHHFSQPVYI